LRDPPLKMPFRPPLQTLSAVVLVELYCYEFRSEVVGMPIPGLFFCSTLPFNIGIIYLDFDLLI